VLKFAIINFILGIFLSCSGGPRPFSQSKSIDDSRKERGRDFSTKRDVVTGMVYWDARSEQSISAAANSEISGATVRFPLEPVAKTTLASLGTGATLLTPTTLKLLELEDTTQLALSRCLYIGSEEPIDALQDFEISLPLQNETGVSEAALDSDSVVIVFRQARFDTDPNSRFAGIIPRSQFSIKDGVAKIAARYFGMYQVFYFDEPLLAERLVKTSETLLLKSDQATLLEIVESPDEIIRDTDMLPPFKLVVKNAAGEPAVKYKGQISVRLLDESQDILEGTKSLFATDGELVFGDLRFNQTMNFAQLQFADADGLLVEAEPYSVYEKPATKIRIVTTIAEQKAGTKLPVIEIQAINDEGIIDPRFKREITMTIKSGPEKATLSGTVKVRASSGVALFNDLSIDKASTGYQLAVSSSKVSGHASNEFEVKPGAPHTVKIETQPSRGNYQSNISVTAKVEDAYGNLTTDFVGNLTAALAVNNAGATLSGTTAVAVSNGIAQFSNLRVNKPAQDYKFEISGSGLVAGQTNSFVVDPLAASSLSFVTQPANATAGSSFTPTVVLRALDAGGFVDNNYAAAVSLSLNPNPGSASLSGTSSGSFVAGEISFANLSVSAAGTGYQLRASSGSITANSNSFDIASAVGGLWLASPAKQDSAANAKTAGSFCGGVGTEDDPFVICDAASWLKMRDHADAHFVLGANIDLSEDPVLGECQAIWPFNSAQFFTGSLGGRAFRVRSRCTDYASYPPIDLAILRGEVDDLWFDSTQASSPVLRILKDEFESYQLQHAAEMDRSESMPADPGPLKDAACQSAAASGFRAGDGSSDNPYLLCNEVDWKNMLKSDHVYFALGDDIDLFDSDVCRSDCAMDRLDAKYVDGRGFALRNLTIDINAQSTDQSERLLLPHFFNIRFEQIIIAVDAGVSSDLVIGRDSLCSSAAAHFRHSKSSVAVGLDCRLRPISE
jgi:hypothetical protein